MAESDEQYDVTDLPVLGEEFWGPLRQSPSFGVFTAVRADS